MTDFERILNIIKNSNADCLVNYPSMAGNPYSIGIWNSTGSCLILDFYRDGKFAGIFIDD